MSEIRKGDVVVRHYYYGNPARLDLEVMRKKALELSTKPDHQGQYSHVTIHHHSYTDPCITAQEAHFHEEFPPGPREAPNAPG